MLHLQKTSSVYAANNRPSTSPLTQTFIALKRLPAIKISNLIGILSNHDVQVHLSQNFDIQE